MMGSSISVKEAIYETLIDVSRLNDFLPSYLDAAEMVRTLQAPYSKFLLDKMQKPKNGSFWIELDFDKDRAMIRETEGNDFHHGFLVIMNTKNKMGAKTKILIPLNLVMSDNNNKSGKHSVYIHEVGTEMPLRYVGVTKQRWFSRFSQHTSAALTGSNLVFHRALREHSNKPMVHWVIASDLSYEDAMNMEERLVEQTLYPQGLNMIPGGFAGMKYLNKLGFHAKSIKERDSIIDKLSKMSSIKGMPNPLCAARWANDQDYINRVICGHGDRLTVEQVRQIRLLGDFNMTTEIIMQKVKAKNIRQVDNLLNGKHYKRIA